MPGAEILPIRDNVVMLSRPAADPRREAVAHLRAMLPRGATLYAVRRAHDPGFGWIVCDFYRIDGTDVTCVSEPVARVLECFDPAREVGVKLRRAQGGDPLALAADRLSVALFAAPGTLTLRQIG